MHTQYNSCKTGAGCGEGGGRQPRGCARGHQRRVPGSSSATVHTRLWRRRCRGVCRGRSHQIQGTRDACYMYPYIRLSLIFLSLVLFDVYDTDYSGLVLTFRSAIECSSARPQWERSRRRSRSRSRTWLHSAVRSTSNREPLSAFHISLPTAPSSNCVMFTKMLSYVNILIFLLISN